MFEDIYNDDGESFPTLEEREEAGFELYRGKKLIPANGISQKDIPQSDAIKSTENTNVPEKQKFQTFAEKGRSDMKYIDELHAKGMRFSQSAMFKELSSTGDQQVMIFKLWYFTFEITNLLLCRRTLRIVKDGMPCFS